MRGIKCKVECRRSGCLAFGVRRTGGKEIEKVGKWERLKSEVGKI